MIYDNTNYLNPITKEAIGFFNITPGIFIRKYARWPRSILILRITFYVENTLFGISIENIADYYNINVEFIKQHLVYMHVTKNKDELEARESFIKSLNPLITFKKNIDNQNNNTLSKIFIENYEKYYNIERMPMFGEVIQE